MATRHDSRTHKAQRAKTESQSWREPLEGRLDLPAAVQYACCRAELVLLAWSGRSKGPPGIYLLFLLSQFKPNKLLASSASDTVTL